MTTKNARFIPLVVMLALCIGAARLGVRTPADDMALAAGKFLDSLTPELRAKAVIGFDDKARTDWHFIPRTRPGIPFGEMNDAQRAAARVLMRSALSSRGALKVEQIIALESILRDVDKGTPDEALREPKAYTISVYGEPGAKDGRWGWKIEGHHISLNFTLPERDQVRTLPSFLGASPAQVRQGPGAGLRVLALEEDLARELARSLDDSQRKTAVLPGEVPREILTRPGGELEAVPAVGLAHSSMTPAQQALLLRLIEEYAHNLRHELGAAEMDRIRTAGLEQVRFAWAGELEPGRPHYYRISGPTFIIEYDNTQNGANHVHTVWHDLDRDFGEDLLRAHYEREHQRK